MKKIILPLSAFLIGTALQAQLFTYSPGASQYVELPMDMITEIYTYVTNATDDTMHVEWRKIEDTLPLAGEPGEGWFTEMCDFGSCWDYLPNTAVMIPPIAPGGAGFLKLLINPQNMPGAGAVHYWVYPEGQMDLHEDVWFYVWTPGLSVAEMPVTGLSVFPNPCTEQLTFDAAQSGIWTLSDASGRLVQQFNTVAPARIVYPVAHLNPGLYFLQSPTSETVKIIIE
ncbi:MAG: T9SS type A sorting domain-containing protein [Flavobacteriales bacterium]|nr:T9SS type A sorting domain-containing protein [Flavobacteriales bacterium]